MCMRVCAMVYVRLSVCAIVLCAMYVVYVCEPCAKVYVHEHVCEVCRHRDT